MVDVCLCHLPNGIKDQDRGKDNSNFHANCHASSKGRFVFSNPRQRFGSNVVAPFLDVARDMEQYHCSQPG